MRFLRAKKFEDVHLEPFKNWGTARGTIPLKVGYDSNLSMEVTNGANGYRSPGNETGAKAIQSV